MPCDSSSCAGPMPESCRSCGDWTVPGRTGSLRDRHAPCLFASVPKPFHADRARRARTTRASTCAPVTTVRLGRVQRRPQERDRGARAPAVADAELVGADAVGASRALKSRLRGRPSCAPASTQASQQGWSLRRSETPNSPLRAVVLARAARVALVALEVRQHARDSPSRRRRRAPSRRSPACWPRMKIRPLIEEEPPSTRPRGQTMLRPAVPSAGSVSNRREKRWS